MPPTRLPLVIRLGGIRSLLSFCAIMTAGLAAALSPVAVAVWAPSPAATVLTSLLLMLGYALDSADRQLAPLGIGRPKAPGRTPRPRPSAAVRVA